MLKAILAPVISMVIAVAIDSLPGGDPQITIADIFCMSMLIWILAHVQRDKSEEN